MELFVSGVKVPKLGSLQDVIARQYLVKKAQKEITLNKLQAQMAMVSNPNPESGWSNTISQMWNSYVNTACYMEDEVHLREEEMQLEFEHWKTIKPVMYKDENGHVKVKGIVMPKAKK